MDKENKKFRQKARQVWNQKVRALVDFVKRKDKRVQAWKTEQERILKEKEEALLKKQAEDKAKRLSERKKLYEEAKITKPRLTEENLEQLEVGRKSVFGCVKGLMWNLVIATGVMDGGRVQRRRRFVRE